MSAAGFSTGGGASALALALGLSAAAAAPARAAEAEVGWFDTAELSYVVTAGNSETSTLGFRNQLRRAWERSSFQLDAGGIRAESTTITRFAVGDADDFSVRELSDTNTTAENYYLSGRYDRNITDRFFWFAGAGWDRNEFAGIQNRYTGFGGVGNIWVDKERTKFRTDYSLTYTKQEDVIDNPDVSDTFLGARLGWNFLQKIGANASYGNDLIVDDNLDETSDYRADMTNWLTVSMSSRVALKVSLRWLYDHEPSFQEVDLFDANPNDPATVLLGQALAELDDLDTVFTTSLVIKF